MTTRTNRQTQLKLLGTGVLSWLPFERRTDRYGTVLLIADTDGQPLRLDLPPARTRGHLTVEVIESRPTRHVGDWALGLDPRPLQPGNVVSLSAPGRLIVERHRGWAAVGVRPCDGRAHHWLDPRVLYQLVDQVVRLSFDAKRPGTDTT